MSRLLISLTEEEKLPASVVNGRTSLSVKDKSLLAENACQALS